MVKIVPRIIIVCINRIGSSPTAVNKVNALLAGELKQYSSLWKGENDFRTEKKFYKFALA